MARIFNVNKNTEILCESISTRYGFRHDARLFINGYDVEKAKCCYYNRTWERFEYETVIMELLKQTKYLSLEEKAQFKASLEKER